MNKKSVGEMIKEIRQTSGLEAEVVYQKIMTRTNLYRIENNKQDSRYELTLQIIKRLSVGVSEFEFLRNGYQTEPLQEFMKELRNIRTSVDIEGLRNLLIKVKEQILIEPSESLIDFERMVLGYITLQETGSLHKARKHFTKIWERLEKKDNWYYYDVVLISNILFIFDEDVMNHIFNRLNTYYALYESFDDMQRIKRNTLYNYCTYLRVHKRILEVEKPIKEVLKLAEAAKDTFQVFIAQYCLCEVEWVKGETVGVTEKVKAIIDAYTLCKEKIIADDIKNDWRELTGEEIE